ncbi:YybH family protein [Conyzicola nivalis]|nr:nuclear transport factor 2 family protein [Conyzicola nivalis]
MTTTDEVTRWIEAYRSAWISNDADEVAALFTEDALYEFRPNDPEPWRGRDEIVTGWLEEPDAPDTWTFDFKIVGLLDDGTAVVQGVTEYLDENPTYDNLWLIAFEEGKASRFTEWYMEREQAE